MYLRRDQRSRACFRLARRPHPGKRSPERCPGCRGSLLQFRHELPAQVNGRHHGHRRSRARRTPASANDGRGRLQVAQVARFRYRTKKLSGAGLRFLKNSRHRTGRQVRASSRRRRGRRRRSRPSARRSVPPAPHREQREEGADHDGRREEQRPFHLVARHGRSVLQGQVAVLARTDVR